MGGVVKRGRGHFNRWETICPKAADVIVASPKATPIVESIASPAWIITRLSMKPKPIMGTAIVRACRLSCRLVGAGTPDAVAELLLHPLNLPHADACCARRRRVSKQRDIFRVKGLGV